MRISTIQISNILGLARADIAIDQPILLVAGRNEAGKSTLADAVSMAILGTPRRVKLKKDLAKLLHCGAAKGRVTLQDGEELLGEYKLPKGEHTAPALDAAEFLPLLLDPSAFAALPEGDRRSLLFKLTRCKVSPDTTEHELIAAGVDPEIAAELKPLLRSGFPAACAEAKERATQAKGAWRATTGENWGSEKADGWEPEMPAVNVSAEEIEQAKAYLASTNQEMGEAVESIGAARQAHKSALEREQKIAELSELAGLVERRRTKLGADQASLAEWSAKLREAEALAAGEDPTPHHECPHCSGKLQISNGKVAAYREPEQLRDADAARKAAEYRGYVDSAERAVANSERDLKQSQDAAAALNALIEQRADAPSEQAIANGEAVVEEIRQTRDRAAAKLALLMEAHDAIQKRAQVISTAAQHHVEVMAYLRAADELSPSGIPSRILAKAIGPVNDSLAILARMSGWKPVTLADDMAIFIGDREYGLCSESAKWRADTMLAIAIAQLSELRFVMLDRFDVLDLPGRADLIGMLLELSSIKAMDQVIICGTMKEIPKGMPAEIQAVWVQNGIAEGGA
jgi:energy-coupling factor transporter ATP-binding protein EcfA2